MSRQLGITQINMYVDMVTAEFAPVITALEGRTESIRAVICEQVKMDLGIYELLAEKAALEERINEIEERTAKYTKNEYDPHALMYRCRIDAEIEKRIELLNQPLGEAKARRDSIIKQIRLSSAVPEVRAMFEEIGKEVTKIAETVRSLPPVENEVRRIGQGNGKNGRSSKAQDN
jgi:Mg2+ and Co2+ transporter CorA